MRLTTHCPTCSQLYGVKPSLAGKTIRCRVCQSAVRLPSRQSGRSVEGIESDPLIVIDDEEAFETNPQPAQPAPFAPQSRRSVRRASRSKAGGRRKHNRTAAPLPSTGPDRASASDSTPSDDFAELDELASEEISALAAPTIFGKKNQFDRADKGFVAPKDRVVNERGARGGRKKKESSEERDARTMLIAACCGLSVLGVGMLVGIGFLLNKAATRASEVASTIELVPEAPERAKGEYSENGLFDFLSEGTESDFDSPQDALVHMAEHYERKQQKEIEEKLARGERVEFEDPQARLNGILDNSRLLNGKKRR